jgi:DNA polymerase elongation subunit (family B)
MLKGISVRDFVQNHNNHWDFLLRTKVPRNSKLMLVMDDGTEIQQQNICRYYACKAGGKLVKIMPPLIEGSEDRRLSIDSNWNVKTCNKMEDFAYDIDYDYYIAEAEKLVVQ